MMKSRRLRLSLCVFAFGIVFFAASLHPRLRGHSAALGDPDDIYLASREDMSHVRRLLLETPAVPGQSFIGIVGGGAFLNFVGHFQPASIELVDISAIQVEHGKCLVELVKQSDSRADFVTRFFSRPFSDVLSDETYFRQPGDLELLKRTIDEIPATVRPSCRYILTRIFNGRYDAQSMGLFIAGNKFGTLLHLRSPINEMGKAVNYLYYGSGWLENESSFAATRDALRTATTTFHVSDIGAYEPQRLGATHTYFWGSNLATYFEPAPQAYRQFVGRLHERAAELVDKRHVPHRIYYLSTYQPSRRTDFVPFETRFPTPHADSSEKVARHTRGLRVLELVPGPHGFHREISDRNTMLTADRAPARLSDFDVTLLHILSGSSFRWWKTDKDAEYRELFERSLRAARKLLVLEHNPLSEDFDKNRPHMLRLSKLVDYAVKAANHAPLSMQVEYAIGYKDTKRNLILTASTK